MSDDDPEAPNAQTAQTDQTDQTEQVSVEFDPPENVQDLCSLLFDPDIAQAHSKVCQQIETVPDQNLVFPQAERTLAKTMATVQAISIQARRNEQKNLNQR